MLSNFLVSGYKLCGDGEKKFGVAYENRKKLFSFLSLEIIFEPQAQCFGIDVT